MISSIWLKLRFARRRPDNRTGELSFAFCQFPDGLQRGVNLSTEKRTECGKFRIEQQEFGNAQGTQLGSIFLAIRFERGAVLQQADPLEIFVAIDVWLKGSETRLKCVPIKAAKPCRAFDVTSKLNVMPALAVAHGRVGHAVKQMRTILHAAEENCECSSQASPVGVPTTWR